MRGLIAWERAGGRHLSTQPDKQAAELTFTDVIAAAEKARQDLLATNPYGGEVHIMLYDSDRETQAIMYFTSLVDDEEVVADAEDCREEVREAMQYGGLHPYAINVLPYGEPKIIALRENPTLDEQAAIWALTDEEPNA